jgi:hypothetical protein
MTFTDDDLKRLKDDMELGVTTLLFPEIAKALLARLEASERVCLGAVSQRIVHTPHECYDGNPIRVEIVEAWRKACGK